MFSLKMSFQKFFPIGHSKFFLEIQHTLIENSNVDSYQDLVSKFKILPDV